MQRLSEATAEISPVRDSEVSQWLRILNESMEPLGMMVSDLSGRLNPVLTEPGPPNDKEKEMALPQLCPLADSLRTTSAKLEGIMRILKDVLLRLEV